MINHFQKQFFMATVKIICLNFNSTRNCAQVVFGWNRVIECIPSAQRNSAHSGSFWKIKR